MAVDITFVCKLCFSILSQILEGVRLEFLQIMIDSMPFDIFSCFLFLEWFPFLHLEVDRLKTNGIVHHVCSVEEEMMRILLVVL